MGKEENIHQKELEIALNLFKQARYLEALEKLKLLKINNNDFLINWYLGHTYYRLFDYKLAIQSIKKSIELKSKDTLNLNFLALLYRTINKHDLAILTLEDALASDVKDKNALISLGEVHTDKGNFEKAEKYFLSVLEFEKDNYAVLYQLIKLNKKKYLTQKLTNRIKENLLNITDYEIKIYANLILAQNENLKNEYGKEIELLNNSHLIYLEQKKLAAKEEWNYYSNLLPQFIKRCDEVNIKIDNRHKPIFILGMPRSGTTLVESIIGVGKNSINIGGETNAFDGIFFSKKIIKEINTNVLKTDFKFKEKDFEILSKNLIHHYEQLQLINSDNENIFTDKSITNLFYIDIIKKIFPYAKFIYCSRNPFANILAIVKNFLPHIFWTHSIDKTFKYFDMIINKIDKEIKGKNKNLMVIHLEELSNNPIKISQDLFKFLDFQWSEDCIHPKKRNIIKTASNVQLREPIKKHNLDYLKNYYNYFKDVGSNYYWFKL